ncbi:hypothetical protein F511_37342 [Dorcoceras hygrometricum]|uniref:Uncharacterized protein n=1 Tax=Dorcoceras hygrometricum TaxID=472368 RepID=A0A2Z7AYA3_9LAMI|nr:hypothetical protein F511_37342 [Dorcoceras hygrometricum]
MGGAELLLSCSFRFILARRSESTLERSAPLFLNPSFEKCKVASVGGFLEKSDPLVLQLCLSFWIRAFEQPCGALQLAREEALSNRLLIPCIERICLRSLLCRGFSGYSAGLGVDPAGDAPEDSPADSSADYFLNFNANDISTEDDAALDHPILSSSAADISASLAALGNLSPKLLLIKREILESWVMLVEKLCAKSIMLKESSLIVLLRKMKPSRELFILSEEMLIQRATQLVSGVYSAVGYLLQKRLYSAVGYLLQKRLYSAVGYLLQKRLYSAVGYLLQKRLYSAVGYLLQKRVYSAVGYLLQ